MVFQPRIHESGIRWKTCYGLHQFSLVPGFGSHRKVMEFYDNFPDLENLLNFVKMPKVGKVIKFELCVFV